MCLRSKGNEALTAEVARLTAEVARQTEQLRSAASELDAAQAALTETERQSQKLARELADMAGKLKLAQELADNAKSVAAAAQKQLQESEGKIRELESALNKSVVGEKCQKERAEGLQVTRLHECGTDWLCAIICARPAAAKRLHVDANCVCVCPEYAVGEGQGRDRPEKRD